MSDTIEEMTLGTLRVGDLFSRVRADETTFTWEVQSVARRANGRTALRCVQYVDGGRAAGRRVVRPVLKRFTRTLRSTIAVWVMRAE